MQLCRAGLIACVTWVALAPMVAGQSPEYGRFQFDDTDREHWAFQPVSRPEVPSVQDSAWIETPVDAFLLSQLEEEGIRPAARADRRTLLRRVHLDLIGLPPSLDEQRAFLSDESPDALHKVVDQLLARPEYGERWARHWLDVVRYAESNGYERDGAKPHAWRYRDYVVGAFNQDKPYDRFVLEQLAGDELEGSDATSQIATTFLRLGLWDDEPADPQVDRYDQLDDVLGATAATFMGITLRCARCHDHKFEPFSQRDYTRMLSIFEPLKRPQNGRTDLDCLVGTREELTKYREAMAATDSSVAEITKKVDELKTAVRHRLIAEKPDTLAPEAQAAFDTPAEARSDAQKDLVRKLAPKLDEKIQAAMTEAETEELAALQQQIDAANAKRPAEPPRAYIWNESSTEAPFAPLFARGDPYRAGDAIPPGFPAVLVDQPPERPTPTDHSTGRRLQLARWLVSAEHPLTARVMVNRLWQHHFGDGLVATENDFGLMGDSPTNEPLLDWLSAEFISCGWSIKHMHRLMVNSHAYQLAAVGEEASEKEDPQVRNCWRWRPRRLEAECIRDSVLAASGRLNSARGGPSVFPSINEAVLASQSQPGNGWGKSSPEEACRRSIYVFVKRTLLVPEIDVLDFPTPDVCCEQRQVSTIAPQALTYLNGPFIHEQARFFAERLIQEAGDRPSAQIDRAFELALCRPPTDEERSAAEAFLTQQARQIEADHSAAQFAANAPMPESAGAQPAPVQPTQTPDGNEQSAKGNSAPAGTSGSGAVEAPENTADETPADQQATAPPSADTGAQRDYQFKALAAFCLVLLNSNEFVYME